MPAATSTQLRERVIVRYHEMHIPIDEIVILSGLSHATVYNILQLHNDHGSLHNPLILPSGRHRNLEAGDLIYIQGLLNANPMFLDEIRDHLAETCNIKGSIATLSRSPLKSCNHTQVCRKGST
ncbi:hypothetical protein F4604DRAFT_1797222 [Suillus subluteus]|nr:hypothetical protein F4604DRAFT_1797222 [Suillus subluteus]